MNTYTSFGVEAQDAGTENRRIPDTAKGIHIRKIQGLALPYFDLVLSTITPMMISLTPSKILEIIIMVPTAIALTFA